MRADGRRGRPILADRYENMRRGDEPISRPQIPLADDIRQAVYQALD